MHQVISAVIDGAYWSVARDRFALFKWITKWLPAAHEALTCAIFHNGGALKKQEDRSADGKSEYRTTPANVFSTAVGWVVGSSGAAQT